MILEEFGVESEKIVELDWWDSHSYTFPAINEESEVLRLRVTVVPAQHSSGTFSFLVQK